MAASSPAPASVGNDIEKGVRSTSIVKEGHETSPIFIPQASSTQAWLAVLGASLAIFCTVGFVNAFGVFQEYYFLHQLEGRSEFDISWIGSFATFAMFMGAPIAGLLVDRTGPTVLMCGGSVGTLLSTFMIALCEEYYQFFLAQGVLLGFSMSFLFIPAISILPRHFVKNRSLALGVAVAGSSLGGVVWPIMLDQLLNKDDVSFGWTLRIVGFTMLPLLTIAILTVRPAPKMVPSVESQAEVTSSPKAPAPKTDLSILKSLTFWGLCAGLGLCFLGLWSPLVFVASYAVDLGFSTSLSFYTVSIANGASLFGRILAGVLADRFGNFNVFSMGALASGVVALCWTAAKDVGSVVLWALAYGFTSGCIISLQAPCAAQLATPETHGTVMGLAIGSIAIFGLFGLPISAQLVPHGYLAVSVFTGATVIAGSMLIFSARLLQNRTMMAKV